MVVTLPIVQPTSQPASVMVVTEEFRTAWFGEWSFCSEKGGVGVGGTFHPVGAPTDALRHVAEECADFAGGGAVVVAPPAVFAGVVAADVAALANVGKVTIGVAGLGRLGPVWAQSTRVGCY